MLTKEERVHPSVHHLGVHLGKGQAPFWAGHYRARKRLLTPYRELPTSRRGGRSWSIQCRHVKNKKEKGGKATTMCRVCGKKGRQQPYRRHLVHHQVGLWPTGDARTCVLLDAPKHLTGFTAFGMARRQALTTACSDVASSTNRFIDTTKKW